MTMPDGTPNSSFDEAPQSADNAPDRGPVPAEDGPTPAEAKLFDLLDRYLDSLQQGDVPSRSVMIEGNPELAKQMRCLELLDRLAPERSLENFAPAIPMPADAPQAFGKYELFGEIGRGGMGVVFRARQTDLGRTVALKMILSSRLASADDVRRFYAEARAAGGLRHPNIVGIHEVGEVRGQHFFAMDFVEGRSLAEALAAGPFEPRRAAECVAIVARAVHYLHEHHIVHRDLKPSNILLAADGTPFVTDFGLAKSLGTAGGHTLSGTIVGTPSYMAPEQAAGESSEISARSDVYSLGAILFELLSGRPPFQNANPIDTLLQVIEGQPPRPTQLNRDVPPTLEWICLKCLERDPSRRYGSAAALVDDLERFLRGEPLSVGPPGSIRSLVRWSRQEPVLAAHLGAIATASLIVQLKYMISGSDRAFHIKVISIFAAWALSALVWRAGLRRMQRTRAIRHLWAATDVGLLTLMLWLVGDGLGPLLVGYPLLIVASGLFLDVGLVAFMTTACFLSYGALLLIGQQQPIAPAHYRWIYASALAVIGLVVGYQAYRIRALTVYFDDRRNG